MRHSRAVIALLCCAIGACAASGVTRRAGAPPPMLLGEFTDDYGARYIITRGEWLQHPRGRYRVVRWNEPEQYLIAQNDSGNRSAPGRWTRIDWIVLDGMPPYTWAFCYSAFDAPTATAAESTTIARRDTPRTGCNGFPFSRMKPGAPGDLLVREARRVR